jgi:RHS repeat-associated protein
LAQAKDTAAPALRCAREPRYNYRLCNAEDTADHLGSTSLTTDSAANVVHEARYYPYGGERWAVGVGVTDFGFTGQRDDSFGLMDYNARYYSSRLGRFVSPDSIVPEPLNPLTWNWVVYIKTKPS